MAIFEPELAYHIAGQSGHRYSQREIGNPYPFGMDYEMQSHQGVFRKSSEMGREGSHLEIDFLCPDI